MTSTSKGLTAMATMFTTAPEFASLYGASPASASFITRLYDNVLHRAPDAGGLAFWTQVLDSGAVSKTDILLQFSEGAENHAQLSGGMQNVIEFVPFG